MRGRLIQRFIARIARLDRAGQRLADHYDDDFREPVLTDDGDRVGTVERNELPPVDVPCQIGPNELDRLNMLASGDSPTSMFEIFLHFKDLEARGLVCDDGRADFRKGDRLCAILSIQGIVELELPLERALYVTEARPIGWGLSMTHARRNLLMLRLEERLTATQRFE